jgi:hypothetical protein
MRGRERGDSKAGSVVGVSEFIGEVGCREVRDLDRSGLPRFAVIFLKR